MKTYLIISFVFFSLCVFSQSPSVEMIEIDSMMYREKILELKLEGVDDSYIQLRNNTTLNNSFEAAIAGSTKTLSRSGLVLYGNNQIYNDLNDTPLVLITPFVDSGAGWENKGYRFPTNNHYFRIRGFNSPSTTKYLFEIDEDGDIGIGTNDPKSKLEIRDGDIFISDINKGVIMKSTNGNCWRMTVSDLGQGEFTNITCPI